MLTLDVIGGEYANPVSVKSAMHAILPSLSLFIHFLFLFLQPHVFAYN